MLKKGKHKHKSKPPEVPVSKSPPERIGDYKVLKVLGKGAFGTVYASFDPLTGKTVAIKRVQLHGVEGDELATLQMEIQLLQSLEHKNIVQYIDTIVEPEYLNIVLEYIEAGQLSSLLHNLGSAPPESLIAFYTAQILIGLQYLHKQGVVHRDIKGANILTTKEGLVKLADFGVATKLTDANTGVAGTPYWMAPEVISMHEEIVAASDIWSLGCTIIELLTGNPPYHDLNPMSACYRIVQDPQPPLPDEMSANLENFLLKCLVKDPSERADATTLLRHPWVAPSVILLKERHLLMASPRGPSLIIPEAIAPVTGVVSSVLVTAEILPSSLALPNTTTTTSSSSSSSSSPTTTSSTINATITTLDAITTTTVTTGVVSINLSNTTACATTTDTTTTDTTTTDTTTTTTTTTTPATATANGPSTPTSSSTASRGDTLKKSSSIAPPPPPPRLSISTCQDSVESNSFSADGSVPSSSAPTPSSETASFSYNQNDNSNNGIVPGNTELLSPKRASSSKSRIPPPKAKSIPSGSRAAPPPPSPSASPRNSFSSSLSQMSYNPCSPSSASQAPTLREGDAQDGLISLLANLKSPKLSVEIVQEADQELQTLLQAISSNPKGTSQADTLATFNRNMYALESAVDENSAVRACLRMQRGLAQAGTAEAIRMLLLDSGLAVFHLLIQNTGSVVVQEALFHTLNVALNQPPVSFDNNVLLINLRRACAALGLIGLAAKSAAITTHPPLQLVCASLLRLFCWDDPNSFLASGALFGVQKLLVADKDPRLQWCAVDCIAQLTSDGAQIAHGASIRDVCLKLAGTYEFVRLLTINFNQRANDFCAMRGRRPNKTYSDRKRHSMVTEISPPMVSTRRTLEKAQFEAISRLCISPVDDVDLLDVAFMTFGSVHLRRQSQSAPGSLSPGGEGILLSSPSLSPASGYEQIRRHSSADTPTPTKKDLRKHGSLDVPMKADLGLAVECQKKIALILNTIAKSHDMARQKFTAHEVSSLIMASVACQEPLIAALTINTVATLCSTSVLGKLQMGLETDHHHPQFVSELVYMLKTFLALGEEQVWKWAAADTLHCLHRLSSEVEKESNGSNENSRESQSGSDETGTLVLALKHNALMPQLHYMLIAWANSDSEHKSQSNGLPLNPDDIILKRDTPVQMIQFLFPLLYRIATSFSAQVRSYIQCYKPELFLSLLAHPDYRVRTLDLLYVWLQDDEQKLEAFFSAPETIRVIVGFLSSSHSTEYTKLLTSLMKMLSHGKVLTPIYATFPDFCDELKIALCVRYRDDNSVRLLILRLVYIFISRATQAQLQKITVSLDLIAVLTPLTQDPLSPLVATLADSLLVSVKAPSKSVNSNPSSHRKYKKAAIKRCMLCERVFSLFVRKHYCKQCQLVVCGTCSPERFIVAHVNKEKSKRVCSVCIGFLKTRD